MKKISILLFALTAAITLSAQQIETLPIDDAVRVGHLDNGLTYYIRHNEQPKQRCEFHIAQAVGAVLEEDDQNGLAHFLEHMAFNGTEHFPGKLIIEYFESIGVNFGGNINAYTSIDETVYRLSDVPTIREGIIDSALLVMHDWACAISLLGEEIDNERGVIREEWRTGATASRRMWKEMRALKYPNSQYGKRDVIGDTAVINNFSYDALRAYYKKWYGPDNQAVIVVGDIDVDQIEAKIKQLWQDVPARANRGERPLYSVDLPTEPRVCIVTDKEAQQTQIQLEYHFEQLAPQLRGSNIEYLRNVCNSLICQMMNNRTDELKMNPKMPFMYDYFGFDEVVKLRDAFIAITVAKQGQEKEAYRDLLMQVEKMRRFGFTNAELERAKTDCLTGYESSYNSRNTRDNISYAREYIRNFEDHEAIPGIEWEYNFVKQILPMISLEMINQIAAEDFVHNAPIIAIQGPDKEGINLPGKEEALAILKEVSEMQLEAPKEEKVDTKLVKKAPRKGKIKKSTSIDDMGVVEFQLSNGIRVVIKPTPFEDDEISLLACSKGGMNYVDTEDLLSANLISNQMQFMGVGNFNKVALEKALTGKAVSVSADINGNSESVSASSTVKDFETMLQLVYLTFTAPRADEEAYSTLLSLYENQLRNKESNPKAIFSDSVSLMSSNHSERTVTIDVESLKHLSLDRALAVYKDRFSNPADFTFIFIGEIDPYDKATRKLIEKWIGGLKTNSSREQYIDRGVRAPLGQLTNYFTREMQIHTASNRIQYTSYDIPYTLSNRLNMNMIGRILSTRYLESIREREGGSYGVSCYGTVDYLPVACARLIMQFDTDPEKQEKLMSIIHEEVQTIIQNGPLDSDLQKEKESMLKDFQQDLEDNGWWEYCLRNYYMNSENLYTDYKAAVEAITAETVQDMLRQLVSAGNVFEVVMSPAE